MPKECEHQKECGTLCQEDNLTIIIYDEHVWEVGYFSCKNNGYSAYGFRQDGVIIRVISEYEADLFRDLLVKAGGEIVTDIPERFTKVWRF